MKELRFHGRGGQGVVKAAQIIVSAVVDTGKYGQFIPFFGVERKGSPVFGFLRVDDKDIRIKTQVYTPEILVVFDDTLLPMEKTFEGLQENGVVIINTKKSFDELNLPENAKQVYLVDATGIALENIKRNIPNTTMLGAFAKACEDFIDWEVLQQNIKAKFGDANVKSAQAAYDKVQKYSL